MGRIAGISPALVDILYLSTSQLLDLRVCRMPLLPRPRSCHRQPLLYQQVRPCGESVLGTWEACCKVIENQGPTVGQLLTLLAFVNFEDIFMGIFDAPTRVAAPSEATRPPD